MSNENETKVQVNFDQFEGFIDTINNNMDAWWANMLISRVWNSSQMAVGSACEKLSKINHDTDNIQERIDVELEKIPETAPEKAKVAIRNRTFEKYEKALTRFKEDMVFYTAKIETGKNTMAWIAGFDPNLANHFLKSDDCSVANTIDFITGRDLQTDDDIRVGYVKINHPSMAFNEAIIEYYGLKPEKIDEIEVVVDEARANRELKQKSMENGLVQAREFARLHSDQAKPYAIPRDFMQLKFESIINTVAKSELKIKRELEKAGIELLKLGLSEGQVAMARVRYQKEGKYDFVELRNLFEAENNSAGVMIVIDEANQIQKALDEIELSNTMLEPLDQQELEDTQRYEDLNGEEIQL